MLGVTPISSQGDETGSRVSMASANAIAPLALIEPAPCDSTSTLGSSIAVNSRIALTRFGDGESPPLAWRLASMMSATTPVATAAAILVPLSAMYALVSLVAAHHSG